MEWNANPQQIADGYGIDLEEWIDSISGSTTSFLTEAIVAKLLGGVRVKGKQLPYDVIVKERVNQLIEVRNICKTQYVYFSPSTATGKGRFFCQEDHDKKLNALDSYIFCDLRNQFRTPPKFHEVTVDEVLTLQERDIIKEGKVTKKQFFKLFPYETHALRK